MNNKIKYKKIVFRCFITLSILIVSTNALTAQNLNSDGYAHFDDDIQSNTVRLPAGTKYVDAWGYPAKVFSVPKEASVTALINHNCNGFNLVFLDEDNGSGVSSNIGFADPTPIVLIAGHPLAVSLGSVNTTLGVLRRWTACEVFKYISQTIVLPVTNPPDIYFDISETDGLGALGYGSALYNLATISVPGTGAGLLQQHITTGIDPTPTAGEFDAKITLDFGVRLAGGFNTPINSDANDLDPTHGLYLYTIILHEATHCLGFASSIGSDGKSKITLTNPGYYSLFDRYIVNSSGGTLMTGNSFVGSISQLISNTLLFRKSPTPNSRDYPIYSPVVWAQGSSLSHFDNARDNFTLIMNPAYVGIKRAYEKPELEVLCNLGYTLTVSGFICGDRYAIGVNDFFTATSTTNPVTVNVIANDYDLDVTGGPGVGLGIDPATVTLLSNSSGTIQVSGNNLIYTPSGNFCGNVVIRYRPFTISNGFFGSYANLTINIPCPSYCIDDPCNLICNGSFEYGLTVAQFDNIVAPLGWNTASTSATSAQTGWLVVPNTNGVIDYNTPDYYYRNSTLPQLSIPLSIIATQPPGVETPTAGNNRYMGVGEGGTLVPNSIIQSESFYRKLVKPLVTGANYKLTYSARAITHGFDFITLPPGTPSAGPAILNTSFSVIPPVNNIGVTQPPIAFTGTNFIGSPIAVVESINLVNTWTNVTINFSASANSEYIVLEPAYTSNATTPNIRILPYMYIDNIRLIKVGDPQISIVTTANSSTVALNQNITFSLNVCNGGSGSVTNIAVTNSLPPGFTFVSSSFFTAINNTYTIPSLAAGTCTVLTITAKPDYATVVVNTDLSDCAYISSLNNCVQTQSCAIVKVLATNISVSTSETACNANGCSDFKVTVSNLGPIPSNNIKVTCIPAACAGYIAGTFTSIPAGAATLTTPANTYLIPNLAVGATVTINFPVCAPTTGTCITSNTASLASMNEYDTNINDNGGSIVLTTCSCIKLIRLH